jgi:hypothetical protein
MGRLLERNGIRLSGFGENDKVQNAIAITE